VITIVIPADGETGEDQEAVEFPPRLTAAQTPIQAGEVHHGQATAKIA
jgi:hypothetical protein